MFTFERRAFEMAGRGGGNHLEENPWFVGLLVGIEGNKGWRWECAQV